MAQSEDIWSDLGFVRNPYDYKPLKVNEDDRSIFVGRSNEERQFKLEVSGRQGGIVMVEGRVGVGKTSFVNMMQYDKWKGTAGESKRSGKMMPCFETIELKENIETTDFMLSVLSNFMYSLERIHGTRRVEANQKLFAGKELIANTLKSGYGFSISILGSGFGASKQTMRNPPSVTVLSTVNHVMNECFEAASKQFGYEAFIIPVNNLDAISDESVTAFLNSARDTLLSIGQVWWILTARLGFFSYLETHARRVSEMVTGTPVRLEPLSLEEVHNAVEKRMVKFAIPHVKTVSIVPQEIVDYLHKVSNGEIRYAFKRLSDLVYQFRLGFPSERQIPARVGLEILRSIAQNRVNELNLTERERKILQRSAEIGTFRVRDFALFGVSSLQNFQRDITKFSKMGLLNREEKNKREVAYSSTGDVNLAFKSITL
ncbi:MAG: hypothetical protein JRN52_13135 [Nitrososphaerota archaeon]|nr:hypothetical protein [Nitrososphaerota archaeon]